MGLQMSTKTTMASKRALFLGFFSESVSQQCFFFFPVSSTLSSFLPMLFPAQWRQTYFRPNKPLPTDVGPSPSCLPIAPRRPFRRAMLDFVVSCLFLGIPYIFFERTRLSSRIDEESGLRNATPTLIIGACTCLVVSPICFYSHG